MKMDTSPNKRKRVHDSVSDFNGELKETKCELDSTEKLQICEIINEQITIIKSAVNTANRRIKYVSPRNKPQNENIDEAIEGINDCNDSVVDIEAITNKIRAAADTIDIYSKKVNMAPALIEYHLNVLRKNASKMDRRMKRIKPKSISPESSAQLLNTLDRVNLDVMAGHGPNNQPSISSANQPSL